MSQAEGESRGSKGEGTKQRPPNSWLALGSLVLPGWPFLLLATIHQPMLFPICHRPGTDARTFLAQGCIGSWVEIRVPWSYVQEESRHTQRDMRGMLFVTLLGVLTSDIEHGDQQAQQPPLPEDLL